jgi:hypothetical protein
MLEQLEQDLIVANLGDIQDFDSLQVGNAQLYITYRRRDERKLGNTRDRDVPTIVWFSDTLKHVSGNHWGHGTNHKLRCYNIWGLSELFSIKKMFAKHLSPHTILLIETTIKNLTPTRYIV